MDDYNDGDPFGEESGSALDLKVLVLYGLGRSRFLVAFCLLVGTAVGLVAAAAKPNVYSAVARLHFLAGKREGMSPEVLAGLEDRWQPAIGVMDEIVLLEDPEIYSRVARELGVRRVLAKPDPSSEDTERTAPHVRLLHSIQSFMNSSGGADPCGDEESEDCVRFAGLALKEKTSFVALPRSNVIEVHHESTSPERAQEFAQALVEAFVQRHREIFSAQPHAEGTRQEMLEAYDRYQESTDRYREHRKLCGFQNLGEETGEIRREITELRAELRSSRARRTQVTGELEQYEKYLLEIPEDMDKITDPVFGENPQYAQVQKEIFSRELELSFVSEEVVYTERERKTAVIQRQIERLNDHLVQMSPVIELKPQLIDKVPNPVYIEYKRQVDSLVAEDNGLALTIQENERSLRQLLEQLDLAGECEKTHDHWSEKIKDAEKDHTELKAMHFQMRSLSNLDAAGESNLRIYQAALLPLVKSGPKRAKTLLMGLFGGLAAGMGVAVLRQLLESRVRYARTLESQLGLTVLAVVPEAASLRKLGRRRAVAGA